jgi:hypothetical protein
LTKHVEKGEHVWECDGCDELLKSGTSEWLEAKAALDGAGWRTEKVADEWLHLCPNCRKKSSK